jgi:hypothetical protein
MLCRGWLRTNLLRVVCEVTHTRLSDRSVRVLDCAVFWVMAHNFPYCEQMCEFGNCRHYGEKSLQNHFTHHSQGVSFKSPHQ